MQETWVWSLGGEDPLQKERATHSSILAWEIPWTEESDGLQSVGLQKSWTRLSRHACSFLFVEIHVCFFFPLTILLYFGCAGSSLLCGLFSSCSEQSLSSSCGVCSHCSGRSRCRAGAQQLWCGLSCSAACGTFLGPGLSPCLLHWQVDSLPLSHEGSPHVCFLCFPSFLYKV